MMADYKDATRGVSIRKYVPNTFDLGDGEIDFPACHRVLKSVNFKSWLCADLDIARNGPQTSYAPLRRLRRREARAHLQINS